MDEMKLQALSASEETARYYLQQTDVDGMFELFSGLVSVEVFILITQLILIGIALVVVFTVSIRRL